MKTFISVLAIGMLLFGTAQANPMEQMRSQYKLYQIAQKLYPNKIEKVKSQILGTRKMSKGVARYVKSYLDWNTYAELSFRDWDKLTNPQKKQLTHLLKKVTINRYADLFDPKARYMVQFGENVKYITVRGQEYARVNTLVTVWESHSEIEMGFLFHKRKKRWALCDVYIEDVSKARTFRSALRRIYIKEGFDGVIKTLKKKTKKTQRKYLTSI